MSIDEREPESAPPSLLASLRRAGETLVDTLRNRVELFAVEMEEEKHWLIATLLWTAAAILFGMLAIIAAVAVLSKLWRLDEAEGGVG